MLLAGEFHGDLLDFNYHQQTIGNHFISSIEAEIELKLHGFLLLVGHWKKLAVSQLVSHQI